MRWLHTATARLHLHRLRTAFIAADYQPRSFIVLRPYRTIGPWRSTNGAPGDEHTKNDELTHARSSDSSDYTDSEVQARPENGDFRNGVDGGAAESFLEHGKRFAAGVFMGIANPTTADAANLTADRVGRETRMWLPDPFWTVRPRRPDPLGLEQGAIPDAFGGLPKDLPERPVSAAHYMGPSRTIFYDELYRLEMIREDIKQEELPAFSETIPPSPWMKREDMSVVAGVRLKGQDYGRLLNVLNAIAVDPRCVYVIDDLKRYMRPSALLAKAVSQPQPDRAGRMYATGRRKSSVARVWVGPGAGNIRVNGAPAPQYFARLVDRKVLLEPFLVTGTIGLYDVYATVKGGGTTGQSNALRHGISVALQRLNPALRPALRLKRAFGNRQQSLLTRDARKVERKKPGQKKARKKFAWVKR